MNDSFQLNGHTAPEVDEEIEMIGNRTSKPRQEAFVGTNQLLRIENQSKWTRGGHNVSSRPSSINKVKERDRT